MLRKITIISLICLPVWLQAQRDSIPEIVSGAYDWSAPDAKVTWNTKDAIMSIIRFEHLEGIFAKEVDREFMKDFHFTDLNLDGLPDAVFSGKTKHHQGFYTYIFTFSQDSSRFNRVFESPGYIHTFTLEKPELKLTLRADANPKDFQTYIRKYALHIATGDVRMVHQTIFPSQTEIPRITGLNGVEFKAPLPLRWSPMVSDDDPIDFDGDGKMDSKGNIIARFPAGTLAFRLGSKDSGDLKWSFVIVVKGVPEDGHIIKGMDAGLTYLAGWVRTDGF